MSIFSKLPTTVGGAAMFGINHAASRMGSIEDFKTVLDLGKEGIGVYKGNGNASTFAQKAVVTAFKMGASSLASSMGGPALGYAVGKALDTKAGDAFSQGFVSGALDHEAVHRQSDWM